MLKQGSHLAGMAWFIVLSLAAPLTAADEVLLRPAEHPGDVTRVAMELKAEGEFIPNSPPSEDKAKPAPAKPLSLKVELRLDFDEKLLAIDDQGGASRSVRHISRAGSAINGQIRPMSATIRPDVAILVAENRKERGLVVFSPSGPLYRSELELVQGPGDPLLLSSLLPGRAVKVGDDWNLGNDAAKALSGYDALATNGLIAHLESADELQAKATFKGTVRGAVLGGEGAIECTGSFTFDRKAGRISALTVSRSEKRKPGQIEAGLDVKSTLSVTRISADAPPELSADVLSKLPLDAKPAAELLLFRSPDGKYSLIHDRDWHIAWDGDRYSVLKRLDRGGDQVAQCNLRLGPNLGKGRHQAPKQLRDEIKTGLGARFVQILGEGEIEGPPESGFRYRIAVQGREGDVGVIWYYYHLASPEGEQMLATFTLGQAQQKNFGNQDLQLIGSIEWLGVEAKP